MIAKRKNRPPGAPCTFSLKALPPDIYKIIVGQQQAIMRNKGLNQYSMEQTIYHIIRDWQQCRGGKDIEL